MMDDDEDLCENKILEESKLETAVKFKDVSGKPLSVLGRTRLRPVRPATCVSPPTRESARTTPASSNPTRTRARGASLVAAARSDDDVPPAERLGLFASIWKRGDKFERFV